MYLVVLTVNFWRLFKGITVLVAIWRALIAPRYATKQHIQLVNLFHDIDWRN